MNKDAVELAKAITALLQASSLTTDISTKTTRRSVALSQYEQRQELTVSVIPLPRTSSIRTRADWGRAVPCQVVIEQTVDNQDNSETDPLHDLVEEIQEYLEANSPIVIDGVNFSLEEHAGDLDLDSLVDHQYFQQATIFQYFK